MVLNVDTAGDGRDLYLLNKGIGTCGYGESKICKVGCQAVDLGRVDSEAQVQRTFAGRIPSCLREVNPSFYSYLQMIGSPLTLWRTICVI